MENESKKKEIKRKAAEVHAKKAPGLKKVFNLSKSLCAVEFILPKEAALGAQTAHVVGDFNDWNEFANPMEKNKNGDFTAKIEIYCGREYRFRYLIDGKRWENHWNADRYEPNPYGGEDSILVLVDGIKLFK